MIRRPLVGAVLAALVVSGTGACAGRSNRRNEPELRKVGAPAAEACRPVTDVPASGGSDHRAGTIEYERTPPSSGAHASSWVQVARRRYAVDDAPPVEQVVHNLEHGYVVVWYDPTAAGDLSMLDDVLGAVNERKVFGVPWTRSTLPAPYVLTAWGHERQCTAPSGEALADFVGAYAGDNGDAPEPTAP